MIPPIPPNTTVPASIPAITPASMLTWYINGCFIAVSGIKNTRAPNKIAAAGAIQGKILPPVSRPSSQRISAIIPKAEAIPTAKNPPSRTPSRFPKGSPGLLKTGRK